VAKVAILILMHNSFGLFFRVISKNCAPRYAHHRFYATVKLCAESKILPFPKNR
jgi:hypothetical protein